MTELLGKRLQALRDDAPWWDFTANRLYCKSGDDAPLPHEGHEILPFVWRDELTKALTVTRDDVDRIAANWANGMPAAVATLQPWEKRFIVHAVLRAAGFEIQNG